MLLDLLNKKIFKNRIKIMFKRVNSKCKIIVILVKLNSILLKIKINNLLNLNKIIFINLWKINWQTCKITLKMWFKIKKYNQVLIM